tara:strand:+ start:414 stop:614 length:201 start_codon:yes stop_codon:yes gene_type:complete
MIKKIFSRKKKEIVESPIIDTAKSVIDAKKKKQDREDKIFYTRVGFYLTGMMAFIESTFNLVGGCV